MKNLITEKKKVKPDLNVMEILEDVVDIEQSILLLKRKLKGLVKDLEPSKEINPMNLPTDGSHLTNKGEDVLEKDTEFDRYHRRIKDD